MIKKAMSCSLICLILVNSITGCYTHKEFHGNEMNALEEGGKVKVITISDEIYYLTGAVFQDSIITEMKMIGADRKIQIQIPVSEIKTVEVREFNVLKSILLVGGVGAVITGIVIVSIISTYKGPDFSGISVTYAR